MRALLLAPAEGCGLWPRLFLPFGQKKRLFMLIWLTLDHFWCSVVTSVAFSSNLRNFEILVKNPKMPKQSKISKNLKNSKKKIKKPEKSQKKSNKNQKNPKKIGKFQKIRKSEIFLKILKNNFFSSKKLKIWRKFFFSRKSKMLFP